MRCLRGCPTVADAVAAAPTFISPIFPALPRENGSAHDLTFAQIEARLAGAGVAPVHARALWRAMYRGKMGSGKRGSGCNGVTKC